MSDQPTPAHTPDTTNPDPDPVTDPAPTPEQSDQVGAENNGTPTDKAPDTTSDRDLGLNLDDDGNLIDPPVLPEYERRLSAARDQSNQDDIDDISAEYADARMDRARTLARREQERQRAEREDA